MVLVEALGPGGMRWAGEAPQHTAYPLLSSQCPPCPVFMSLELLDRDKAVCTQVLITPLGHLIPHFGGYSHHSPPPIFPSDYLPRPLIPGQMKAPTSQEGEAVSHF